MKLFDKMMVISVIAICGYLIMLALIQEAAK